MGDSEMAPGARETDRRTLVRYLRRVNEQQEDAVDPVFDATQGEIQDDHRSFLETFLGMLPAGGRVLDAPCGTGKYFGLVLESGRTLLGVDHSGAHLASAARKFPTVPTEKHDLQDLPCRDEFDGLLTAGLVVAAVGLVGALSLPWVGRVMRPEFLRAE